MILSYYENIQIYKYTNIQLSYYKQNQIWICLLVPGTDGNIKRKFPVIFA